MVLTELSLSVLFLVAACYVYLRFRFSYWKRRGVSYLTPSFPFGNFADVLLMRRSASQFFSDSYNELKKDKVGGVFVIQQPSLVVCDPDIIRAMLVKDFAYFQNHGTHFDEDLDPLSAHLFNLRGQKWKELRVKLTPAFTSGKMKMMFPGLLECGHQLKQHLLEFADSEAPLEFSDVFARFTTDVIASCAFGIECNCLKNPDAEFRKWGKKIFEPSFDIIFRNVMNFIFPSIAKFFKISNFAGDVTKFFTSVVKETVEYRQKNAVVRNDFFQLLIQLHNQRDSSSNGLTLNDVAAQSFVFFFAGFETSSATLSFCLHELATNPDIQDRLRKEIASELKRHNGQVTYEGILNMEYLDKVISETLRKYPPVAFLNRECSQRYEVPGTNHVVDVGTHVVIPLMGLQRDPQHFPDPDRFDPERFSEEVKSQRHHYAYMPFGEGPRICIGQRFGLMQTKVGLVSVLSNFQVTVSSRTIILLKLDPKSLFTAPLGGMWLKITRTTASTEE